MIILRQKEFGLFGNKKPKEEKERDKFEEDYKKKYTKYGNPDDLLFLYSSYKTPYKSEISTTPYLIYDSKKPKYRIKDLDDLYNQGIRRAAYACEKDRKGKVTKEYREIK